MSRMRWTLAVVCALGVALMCVQPVAAKSARLEVMLTRAQWLADRGQVDRAVVLLRRAMQLSPEAPTPVKQFAALALPGPEDTRAWSPDARVIADALTVLRAIDEVASRDDTSVGERAQSLADERVWATALAQNVTAAIDLWLRRDVLMDRDHAELGRALAALAVRRDDLEAAARALENAVAFNAEDPSLRTDLAAVELARGDARTAMLLFRDVAVANPNDLNAQRDLAGALLATGDALTATGLLRATTGCQQSCDCALELTRAALVANEVATAVTSASHALRQCNDDDPEPALWLANAEQAAGHLAQAKTAYRLAAQRDPQSARAEQGLRSIP